jgi:hypothetical protein
MDNIKTILGQYISERIPKKATNIFWQMFNGIEAAFTNLDYKAALLKRERNILTAQHIPSLRSLAAHNGFEPSLKIPAKGIVNMKVSSKLFSRVGYPLFIPAYSVFTNKSNGLNYYYSASKPFKITNSNSLFIPLVEGSIQTVTKTAEGIEELERFYLTDENIAQGSIVVEVTSTDGTTVEFLEVNSFFDNENSNDNKQFLIKYSNDPSNPIIIYFKGLESLDDISISYRTTYGESGNITGTHTFETEAIVDSNGTSIEIEDDEMTITSYSGFDFGSNGTDENALRAAIGYNHGSLLLFDNTSYKDFISKYSTILLQKITNPVNSTDTTLTEKTINNLYVMRKQSILNDSLSISDYIKQYNTIITNKSYLLTTTEKKNLSTILEEYEYCLTSNNVYDAAVNKFAFQLIFDSQDDIDEYSEDILKLIYQNFAKFLYIKNHSFNVENVIETFRSDNGINLDYIIFNQVIEADKIANSTETVTPYIIKHEDYLPILKGDFQICDSTFTAYTLFTNINIVTS